jgi:hypothetical protein
MVTQRGSDLGDDAVAQREISPGCGSVQLLQPDEPLGDQPGTHRMLSVGCVEEDRAPLQCGGIVRGHQLGHLFPAAERDRAGRDAGGRQRARRGIGHRAGAERIVVTAPWRAAGCLGGPRRVHHGKPRASQYIVEGVDQRAVWRIASRSASTSHDDQCDARGPLPGDRCQQLLGQHRGLIVVDEVGPQSQSETLTV